MNTVAPNLLSTVIYASNAFKVWEDLRKRFDKVNVARSFYLHKEIEIDSKSANGVRVFLKT